MPKIIPTSGTNDFDLAVSSLRAFLQRLRQSQKPPASQWKKNTQYVGSLMIDTDRGRAAGKSGKQIERSVIASFRVAESIGFKGEFRQWEHLLRIGD